MSEATNVLMLVPQADVAIRYEAMCRAITAAYAVDEVKVYRDKAAAIAEYQRMAHNTEAERMACEIRLRAERRLGQLLKEIEKAKGGAQPGVGRRGKQSISPTALSQKTLAEMGISRDESARAQQLANVPEDLFEREVSDHTRRPTAAGIIAAAAPDKPRDAVSEEALWVWGRLKDFERSGYLALDPNELIDGMFVHMQETVRSLAPKVAEWLGRIRP